MQKPNSLKKFISFILALVLTLVPMTMTISPVFNVNAIDTTNVIIKEIVSGLEYEWIGSFSEGLAAVWKNNKWGFIDKTGNEVILCMYDWIWDFNEGMAAVDIRDNSKTGCESVKMGFIDKAGNEAVPFIYSQVQNFSEGLASITIYDDNGSGEWLFVDKTGKEAIPNEDNRISKYYTRFSEDLAYINYIDRELWESEQGFIDKTGTKIISGLNYAYVGDFIDGMASVAVWWNWDSSISTAKWGFIDKTGNEIIPLTYNRVEPFNEGLAAAQKNGKWGFIDKTGKEIIPFIYDSEKIDSLEYNLIRGFKDGLSAMMKGNKWGFIDKENNKIIPFIYDEAKGFSEGFAVVKKDGNWGIIDKTGNEIVPFIYNWIESFNNGLTVSQKDGKWSILQMQFITNPTSSIVYVNGIATHFEAYLLNDNNFFKLRDLAYVLIGTEKQFSIGWDNETNTITLTSGQPYISVGGEMILGDDMSKYATLNANINISKDGIPVEITAYLINGNNFVKLRDVMRLLDIEVKWDANFGNIGINTEKNYDN